MKKHLFIVNDIKFWNKNEIEVFDEDIIKQIRTVLRAKEWDIVFFQFTEKLKIFRIETKIINIKKYITWQILTKISKPISSIRDNKSILISMLNKRSKIEITIQKLSEIWIQNIYIRVSEKSIIKQYNENKFNRLKKISKEATEQSFNRITPQIYFVKNDEIKNILNKYEEKIVFDITKEQTWNTIKFKNTIWIIWPEWWLQKSDYNLFWKNIIKYPLWDSILRAETAWIIWWWIIKNCIIK